MSFTLYLIFAYIIPMIICIVCFTYMYKRECKEYHKTATIGGLMDYDWSVIICSFVPAINIIVAILALISAFYNRFKDTEI